MREVLIVGCGNIAGGFDAGRGADTPPFTHAGAFAQHPDFAVAACVDPDDAQRAAFAERWQVGEDAASIEALAAEPGRFAVISICSPTRFHAGHVDAALALRPQLIFCEKPVAASAAETRALARRCAAAGVLLAVNYTRRWATDVVRLARELKEGAWGAVRAASGVYTKGVVHNGGHMVDLLHLLLGEIDFVSAGAPSFDFWDDDPSVPALLASRAGVPITLAIGDARDYALFELTLVTERGTVAMLDGGQRWVVRRAGDSDTFAGYRSLGGGELREGEYGEAMRAAVTNIAAALDDGVALASDASNALAAQTLCETIRDAALAGSASRRTMQ